MIADDKAQVTNSSLALSLDAGIDASAVWTLKQTDRQRFHLSPDVRRAVLWEEDPRGHSLKQVQILHPNEAALLSLFDGTRTAGETVRCVQYLFGMTPQRASRVVANALKKHGNALMTLPAVSGTSHPSLNTFLVPEDQIDLHSQRLYKPLRLVVRVTDDCVRRCRYCRVAPSTSGERAALPLARLCELWRQCADIGVSDVSLTGGDPLARPDILDIIRGATNLGLHTSLTTKAFVSRDQAAALAHLGIDWLQVSIDTADGATADWLTRSSHFVEQTLASVSNLKAAGISVSTSSVVTRRNVAQVPALVRILADLGVDIMRVSAMNAGPLVATEPERDEQLFAPYDALERLASDLAGIAREVGRDIHFRLPAAISSDPTVRRRAFENRPVCSAGLYGLFVHADGRTTICDDVPLEQEFVVGDVSRQGLMTVWQSPRIADLRFPSRDQFAETGSACYRCPEFDDCHTKFGRCFRFAVKAYGSFYAPAPDCPYAPPSRRLQ